MAEFDRTFQTLMARLTESSREMLEGVAGGRVYARFGDDPGDRFDTALAGEFDTSGLDQSYPAARQSDAAWGKVGAMQVQHTIISALRRDCQMRRRTRIRAMAHAVVRLAADAADTGPLNGGAVEYVKAMLEAAGGI
jgi:hypothetical protein